MLPPVEQRVERHVVQEVVRHEDQVSAWSRARRGATSSSYSSARCAWVAAWSDCARGLGHLARARARPGELELEQPQHVLHAGHERHRHHGQRVAGDQESEQARADAEVLDEHRRPAGSAARMAASGRLTGASSSSGSASAGSSRSTRSSSPSCACTSVRSCSSRSSVRSSGAICSASMRW